MEVSGIYIYKNNHMVLDMDKIISNIIDDLKAENKELKAEITRLLIGYNRKCKEQRELQAENDKAENGKQVMYNEMDAEVRELQVENKELKQGLFTSDVDELKAEIKRLKDKLQAVNDDYNNDHKVHNEYADGLLSEIKELKEDNNKHYPKEYKAEADEYFHHNPKGEKLFFFIVGGDEVDVDGDVTRTLNVGCDTIAEYDNV